MNILSFLFYLPLFLFSFHATAATKIPADLELSKLLDVFPKFCVLNESNNSYMPATIARDISAIYLALPENLAKKILSKERIITHKLVSKHHKFKHAKYVFSFVNKMIDLIHTRFASQAQKDEYIGFLSHIYALLGQSLYNMGAAAYFSELDSPQAIYEDTFNWITFLQKETPSIENTHMQNFLNTIVHFVIYNNLVAISFIEGRSNPEGLFTPSTPENLDHAENLIREVLAFCQTSPWLQPKESQDLREKCEEWKAGIFALKSTNAALI